MELLQLRYFLSLAQTENMTQSAKQLFISPPALCTSIARLEKEIGAPLFRRAKGRIYLNENGKTFAQFASDALETLDFGVKQVQELSQVSNKHISILSTAQTVWNEKIVSFIDRHPDIRVSFYYSSLGEIEKKQDLDNFDIVLSVEQEKLNNEMNRAVLSQNVRFRVCIPNSNPLSSRSSLHVTELKNEHFIFPTPDTTNSGLYYQLCRDVGFEPNVIAECSSELYSYLVQKGLGLAFITQNSKLFDSLNNVSIIPLEDTINGIFRPSCAYWKKNVQLNHATQLFLDFLLFDHQRLS